MHKTNLIDLPFSFKDFVVFLALLILFSFSFMTGANAKGKVKYFEVKTTDGKSYIFQSNYNGKFSVKSGGYKYVILFSEGKARIILSSCRDQLCKKSGAISTPGERLICLPGRLTVTAVGDAKVDAINR
ncbi:MAG: NusG domain II-containing protein [Actinobacteria bacterium]|nr:NusG domain II-containing protein [Actinomycetota bacterium]